MLRTLCLQFGVGQLRASDQTACSSAFTPVHAGLAGIQLGWRNLTSIRMDASQWHIDLHMWQLSSILAPRQWKHFQACARHDN